MEEILKILAGVFGGGLFTSLAFVFAQTGKISSMETKVNQMYEELHDGFTCTKHAEMAEKLGKLEGSEAKK